MSKITIPVENICNQRKIKISELAKDPDIIKNINVMDDLSELILSIPKFKQYENYLFWIGPEHVNSRVKIVPIMNWMCTDTIVGYNIIFFDNEPLAYSTKLARKDDCYYYFLNEEVLNKFITFIEPILIQIINGDGGKLEFSDIEIDEYYNLSYTSSLLSQQHKKGFIKLVDPDVFEEVELMEYYRGYYNMKTVFVKIKGNKDLVSCNINEIYFKVGQTTNDMGYFKLL